MWITCTEGKCFIKFLLLIFNTYNTYIHQCMYNVFLTVNYNNVWNPAFHCIPLIYLSIPLSIHIYMIQEPMFSFIYLLCLLLDICSSTWTMWSFFFLTLKKKLASILIRTANLGELYFMILSSLPHQIFGITFCLWNVVCFHDSYAVSSRLLAKCTSEVFYSSFHCERTFFSFPFCVVIANIKKHQFYSSYIWLSHQILFLLLLFITWMSWIC